MGEEDEPVEEVADEGAEGVAGDDQLEERLQRLRNTRRPTSASPTSGALVTLRLAAAVLAVLAAAMFAYSALSDECFVFRVSLAASNPSKARAALGMTCNLREVGCQCSGWTGDEKTGRGVACSAAQDSGKLTCKEAHRRQNEIGSIDF